MPPHDDLDSGFFITCVGLLLAVGTMMVYSSSITSRPSAEEEFYLSRQMLFLLAAGLAGIAASQAPATFWRRGAVWMFAGTIVLLAAVLVPGLGREVNGAQRWFRVGPISIQPSETAKLTLPMLLAAWHCDPDRTGDGHWLWLRSLAVILGTGGLIALEPDLGTALFVVAIGVLTLFLAGLPARYLLWGGLGLVPAASAILVLKPYQVARLHGFIDTWVRPESAPYQVRQSLTTLGVGGLLGTGLGRGWQKLSFLPEANTDFVFAVLGEELGLLGTGGVLLLWLGVCATGNRLARRCPPGSFAAVVSLALLCQLVLQAAVNMAVVTALLPPKGISHPFLSYGGSNLAVNLVAVGVIFGLTRRTASIAADASGCESFEGERCSPALPRP